MCRKAAADGITHLVATPHANDVYSFDPELNRRKLAELQSAIGNVPKLLPGCDFHLSYDNVQECLARPKDFTINNTSYLLVEFPDQFIPEQMDRVFYEIQLAGLVPILTHPERNPVCARRPELLYYWVTRGCLVQVTAHSSPAVLAPKHAASRSSGWRKTSFISSHQTPTTLSVAPPSFRNATARWRNPRGKKSRRGCFRRILRP